MKRRIRDLGARLDRRGVRANDVYLAAELRLREDSEGLLTMCALVEQARGIPEVASLLDAGDVDKVAENRMGLRRHAWEGFEKAKRIFFTLDRDEKALVIAWLTADVRERLEGLPSYAHLFGIWQSLERAAAPLAVWLKDFTGLDPEVGDEVLEWTERLIQDCLALCERVEARG